ncbi:MAG: hypothetical protein HY720_32180 [Planctomycetes bacterium]|nr:hypothetical protein [Planctomycetota bacterium]
MNNALGALASGAMGRDDSPSKIIEQMRNTGKPVVLGYQSEAGPHAVVAYGYTPGEGIYIWNPNDPPGVVRRIKLTADGAIAVWHRPDGKVSSESDWGLGPAPSDSIRISILPSPGDSSVQTQLVTGILAFQVALAVSELAALESVSLWLGAALDPSSIQTSDPVVNPTPTATSDFLNAWANLTVHGGHMIDHGYYERAYGAVHTGMGDDWPSLSHDQLDTGYSEDLTLIAHGRAADVIAADIAWLRAAEYHDPDEGFPDFTKSQLDSTASQLQQALDSQSCPSTHTLIHEGMFGLHDHWDSFTDNPAHAVMHAEIDAFHAAYHDAPDPHTGLHAALDVLHDQFHDRFEPFDAAEDAAHTRLHQDLDGTHRDFHAMMAGHSWH